MRKALKIMSALMAAFVAFGCFAVFGGGETVEAASYPDIFPDTDTYDMKIPHGKKGKLKFVMFPEYHNEHYFINIYKGTSTSKKNLVASCDDGVYNSDGTLMRNLTVTFNTKGYARGTYTVEAYMMYYSYGDWWYSPYTRTCRIKIVHKNYGWHKNSKGKWYCDTKGKCYKSTWKTIGGKKYYFNKKGYAVTGWNTIKGKRYYFNGKGELKKY